MVAGLPEKFANIILDLKKVQKSSLKNKVRLPRVPIDPLKVHVKNLSGFSLKDKQRTVKGSKFLECRVIKHVNLQMD